MIIEKDSPLRHLPTRLEPKQASFLDGIRFSVDIAELAYARLHSTLLQLALTVEKPDQDTNTLLITTAISDAWSIVDSINRLRDLLLRMPGLKRSTAYPLKKFLKNTESIADLRNTVQHLDKEIAQISTKGLPVWGTLSWFTLLNPRSGRICTIIAGKLIDGTHPVVNPIGKMITPPIDYVTLTCNELVTNLSAVISELATIMIEFQKIIKKSFGSLETSASDILVSMDIDFERDVTPQAG
jgi:hypothetical protein